MKKLDFVMAATVIILGAGFVGYLIGFNAGKTPAAASNESSIAEQAADEMPNVIQEDTYETRLWEGEYLSIENIEPKGDKYVITGVLWEDYALTKEDVHSVKEGEPINILGQEYIFAQYAGENYCNWLDSTGRYSIWVETDGIWRVYKEEGGGGFYRSSGKYVEIEVDANLPYEHRPHSGANGDASIKTVKDLVVKIEDETFSRLFEDNMHSVEIKNGEYVKLYGSFGGV